MYQYLSSSQTSMRKHALRFHLRLQMAWHGTEAISACMLLLHATLVELEFATYSAEQSHSTEMRQQGGPVQSCNRLMCTFVSCRPGSLFLVSLPARVSACLVDPPGYAYNEVLCVLDRVFEVHCESDDMANFCSIRSWDDLKLNHVRMRPGSNPGPPRATSRLFSRAPGQVAYWVSGDFPFTNCMLIPPLGARPKLKACMA
jgi:hypothetical protein